MYNFNLMLYEYAKKYNLNTLTKRKNAFEALHLFLYRQIIIKQAVDN